MQIFFAHSAARHRVSQERIRCVIEHCGLIGGEEVAQMMDAKGRPLHTKSGEIVTDELIEALAAEAEAGYDLAMATWECVTPGTLNGDTAPRVSFRASRTLYEAARARAAREGRTLSALAREAVERYVRDDTN